MIDKEQELCNLYRLRILEVLKDLTNKIESDEDLPHGEQDSKLLSDIEDELNNILNNWYY